MFNYAVGMETKLHLKGMLEMLGWEFLLARSPDSYTAASAHIIYTLCNTSITFDWV